MAKRSLLVLALVATVSLVFATPASAHDPIFLTDDQVSPETGPYLPDGTISFAVYGSLLSPGDTRGLEFDLRDGDDLYLSLLIPDLVPEIELADADLPVMTLIAPDGSETEIAPDVRTPFADPFSGTNYVTLYETVEPADGGRYQLTVTGQAPTRFVVAVGTREEFFTPAERTGDRPSSFPGIAEPLNAWYTTPADGSEPVNAEDAGSEVDVDVDLIEDALDELDEDGTPVDDPADEDTALADPDADSDDGGSGNLVAPIAIAAAVVIGAGALIVTRRRTA